jgi:hypothetical protein
MWARKHGKACVSKNLVKNSRNCLRRMDWTTKNSCSWKSKAKTVKWRPAPCCAFKDCHLAAYSKSEACVKNANPATRCPKSAMVMDEAFTGQKFDKKGKFKITFRGTLRDFQAEYPTCGTFYVKSLKIQLHGRTQVTKCKVNNGKAKQYAKKDKNWYKTFSCSTDRKKRKYCVCPKDATGHALQPAVCSGATNCKNDVGKYGNFVLYSNKGKVLSQLKGWKMTADWKRHPAYTWKFKNGQIKVSDLGAFAMRAKWNNGIVMEHLMVEAYSTPAAGGSGASCPGNASKKGAGARVIDVEDLLAVLSAFGKKGKGIAADVGGQGTSTPDGVVDVEDMLIVLAHFGKKC